LPPNDAAVKFMNSQIQQLIANPNDMVWPMLILVDTVA
jgi:hypothetical protein